MVILCLCEKSGRGESVYTGMLWEEFLPDSWSQFWHPIPVTGLIFSFFLPNVSSLKEKGRKNPGL